MRVPAILLLALLAACNENSTPAPNVRASVTMDASKWVFQYGANTPKNPQAIDGGWQFDFPSRDGVHHLVHRTSGYLQNTIRIRAKIERSPGAEFREVDPGCGSHNAAFRLFFQRSGDDLTASKQDYRWWGVDYHLLSSESEANLTIPVIPGKWTQVFGKSGTTNANGFNAAIKDVTNVGMTFGGCFAAHGAYVVNGTARMIVTDFALE